MEILNNKGVPLKFRAGYKSEENYEYVRGRGRGKYVCEMCGIRCKKPSMLKKHLRTHTGLQALPVPALQVLLQDQRQPHQAHEVQGE